MTNERRTAREVFGDIVFCELAADAEIHPDTALKLLEATLDAVGDLAASDRLWLIEHVRMHAAGEHHPDRRRVFEWLGRELLEEAS